MLGLQPDVLPRHPCNYWRIKADAMPGLRYAEAVHTSTRYALKGPSEKSLAIPTRLRGSAGGNVREDGCTDKRALVLPLPVVEDRAGPAQENPLAGDAAGADLAAVEILNDVRSDQRREHQDADW